MASFLLLPGEACFCAAMQTILNGSTRRRQHSWGRWPMICASGARRTPGRPWLSGSRPWNHSSLAWLSRLPVDAVKLDQAYVKQMAEDERCALLVRGFVRVFQEMNCQLGQCYLFGRLSAPDSAGQIAR